MSETKFDESVSQQLLNLKNDEDFLTRAAQIFAEAIPDEQKFQKLGELFKEKGISFSNEELQIVAKSMQSGMTGDAQKMEMTAEQLQGIGGGMSAKEAAIVAISSVLGAMLMFSGGFGFAHTGWGKRLWNKRP